MGNALVTGASGFVGGHLVDHLVQMGLRVRCVFRPSSDRQRFLQMTGVKTVAWDLGDPRFWRRATAGVDYVFHVAGQTRALRHREFWRANAGLTAVIAEAAANQSSPPVFLQVSSLAASGPAVAAASVAPASDGRTPPHPVSAYGRSKLRGEQAALRWAGQMPVSIVRPGIVCGPRNVELWPIFRLVARQGWYAAPGFASRRLAFIDVRDLARLVYQVALRGRRAPREAQADSSCYDACLPEHPTHQEFAHQVAVAVRRSTPVVLPVPEPVLWTSAWLGHWVARWRGRPFPLTLDKVREATAGSWVGDWRRAQDELSFEPEYHLPDGLRDTANCYRQWGWL